MKTAGKAHPLVLKIHYMIWRSNKNNKGNTLIISAIRQNRYFEHSASSEFTFSSKFSSNKIFAVAGAWSRESNAGTCGLGESSGKRALR